MNGAQSTNLDSFVDSNIWIYALTRNQMDEERGKVNQARDLIQSSRHSMSAQVVAEVCTNLLRKGITTESELAELVDDFYKEHAVFPIDHLTFRTASALRVRYSLSFWDSLIVASALQSGAAMLYTEDMQHGLVVDERLRIVNPFLQE